jgi:hypothetical protein
MPPIGHLYVGMGSLPYGGLTVSRVSLVLAGRRAIVGDLPCSDDSFGWYGPIGPVGRIRGIDDVNPSARLGPGFRKQLRGKERAGTPELLRRFHIHRFYSTVVGWPRGISPLGSLRSRRDSLPSPGSSCSHLWTAVTHCQCGRARGCWAVALSHALRRALRGRSRRYLARSHSPTW